MNLDDLSSFGSLKYLLRWEIENIFPCKQTLSLYPIQSPARRVIFFAGEFPNTKRLISTGGDCCGCIEGDGCGEADTSIMSFDFFDISFSNWRANLQISMRLSKRE